MALLSENGASLLVHPASRAELEGDRDEGRKRVVLSKVGAYPILESPPEPPGEFLAQFGATSANDATDARLVYAVQRNAVSFLITEDQDLVHRAARLGLQDRVLSANAALRYFLAYFGRAPPPLPSYLRDVPVHDLDLGDPIFDSLKSDYREIGDGFEAWFNKACREGRRCVRVRLPEGGLAGILLYKPEESEPLLYLPGSRRLKVATFKVSDRLSRQGVGELLLSFALRYCQKHAFPECYVTVFPRRTDIIDFLTPFGFRDIGANQYAERVLLKRFSPAPGSDDLSPLGYFQNYYPAYRRDASVKKFLVPIRPPYHQQLFPEFEPRPGHQQTLDGSTPPTFAAGNAIRKAYLSNSATGKVRPGDILLFYRSEDERRVIHVGLVEETRVCRSPTEIIDFVGNRTVLPLRRLEEMCQRPVLAILFWSAGGLPGGGRGELGPANLAPPISIRELDEEEYLALCAN
jgi:GNAT superfamily N-acetyltransferase